MANVLVATDGSEHAARAVRLVAAIAWPKHTMVAVVGVVPTLQQLAGLPWTPVVPSDIGAIEATELQRIQDATWAAVDVLRAAGLRAHCLLLRGQPGTVILDQAGRTHADLIVMGSRGLGTFEAAFLGSVSEAVIDGAPCPVLVARGERLVRTVIADDGTAQAEAARGWVRQRPHLLGEQAHLIGIVPTETFWVDALVPLGAESAQSLVETHREVCRDLAAHLTADAIDTAATGVPTTSEVRDGKAVHELLESAAAFNADLIVIGTHGRRGIARLVQGSVSRGVVHHATCSVLVVRASVAQAHAGSNPDPARLVQSATDPAAATPMPLP